MELIDIIKKRRSIREYLQKEVSWDQVSEVLDAARWAPAAGNVQSYKFVVVGEKDKKEEVAKACFDQSWMKKAPVQIIACALIAPMRRLYGEKGVTNYVYQNVNSAVENMALRAYDLGLGSCWVGGVNESKMIEALDLPDDVKPICVLTLGYPKKSVRAPTKDPLSSLVRFEEWKGKRRIETVKEPISIPISRGLSKVKKFVKSVKVKALKRKA